jgi:hypothetical protein
MTGEERHALWDLQEITCKSSSLPLPLRTCTFRLVLSCNIGFTACRSKTKLGYETF